MGLTSRSRCPLCGSGAHPWIALPSRDTAAIVGLPSPVDPDDPASAVEARLFDRCTDCAAGIEQGVEIDMARELGLVTTHDDGDERIVIAPNRASWQAGLGGEGWAAIAGWPAHLLLTPRATTLLLERNGYEADKPAFPPWGSNQRWMWQTVLNGITLHTNFATDVLAGRLRPAGAPRGRLAFFADAIASALATPLIILFTVLVEALATLVGRGGRIQVRGRRSAPGQTWRQADSASSVIRSATSAA